MTSYPGLREQVRRALVLGQQKIEQARVLTYHETGRLINAYLRKSENPNQEHGKKTVAKLAGDLGFGEKVFYRCMQFAEKFPTFATRRKLSWGHYRTLFAVDDEKKRLALAEQADKGEWTCRDLEVEVRNLLWDERVDHGSERPIPLLPVPELGPFFTYRVIKPEVIHSFSNEPLVDLGFSTVLELNRLSDRKFAPDTLVTSVKSARGTYSLEKVESRTTSPVALYNYKAMVEKVIDGDTLKVEIDLGFNIRIRQTIRLKGIDCPEMDTPEGKRAKKFTEDALAGCESITIKSVKTEKEKWGRYLGDIFLFRKSSASATRRWTDPPTLSGGNASIGDPIYLNNELITKRHAVRVRE